MKWSGLPYQHEIEAAIIAAPKKPDIGYRLNGTTEQEEDDAPNMIRVGTPEQLESVLASYSLMASGLLLPKRVVKEKIGHEIEHSKAAQALGATSIEYGLFIAAKPRFSLRHLSRVHDYQLSILPAGLEAEQLDVVTAYPTVLSPGDEYALASRGLTVQDMDDLAISRGWPRPLSLQEPEGGQ
jgi:hypothetical protein